LTGAGDTLSTAANIEATIAIVDLFMFLLLEAVMDL
jgi:hypothetical protein